MSKDNTSCQSKIDALIKLRDDIDKARNHPSCSRDYRIAYSHLIKKFDAILYDGSHTKVIKEEG